MLSQLFGSNSRVKILKLFLLNPKQRFFVREVARNLDLQLNSVHREIANLLDIGLIVAREDDGLGEPGVKVAKQDKKYYQVNEAFVFYNELKALLVKSQLLYEKDFTDKLKKIGNIKLMILTGFFVNDAEASVDLFVVGSFPKERLAKVVKDLEADLVKEVNYAVMTEDEFNYRREIADVFLYNILDGEKVVIIDENGVI
jgi:hypothetical protein